MAKSLVVIRMEYKKAKEQAERLEQIAKDLNQTADNRLGEVLSGVNQAWKSDTSAAYLKKGKAVQEQLKQRAAELRKTASAIRTIAQNTYNAELRAYHIAMERKYKG